MRSKLKYPRRCKNKRCRGFVATKACKTPFCARCKWKAYVEKNPLKATFKNLRTHARERGKDFSLTFDQFRRFAEKTDYMRRKGKTSLSLQIDRIRDEGPYAIWNIQAITLRENTRKQFVPYWREYMQRTMAETTAAISEQHMQEI